MSGQPCGLVVDRLQSPAARKHDVDLVFALAGLQETVGRLPTQPGALARVTPGLLRGALPRLRC